MSRTDFLPARDIELAGWADNFAAGISASPALFGLAPADAAAFSLLAAGFRSALIRATDPQTRTLVTVTEKDMARQSLSTSARDLARRIRAQPAVTTGQLVELGLSRRKAHLTPVPAPDTRPVLIVRTTGPLRHDLLITDIQTQQRRARPARAAGAEVFAYVGDGAPPDNLRHWQYLGQSTRSDFTITYTPADAGRPVTLIARWFNSKGQPGPTSFPLTSRVAA